MMMTNIQRTRIIVKGVIVYRSDLLRDTAFIKTPSIR